MIRHARRTPDRRRATLRALLALAGVAVGGCSTAPTEQQTVMGEPGPAAYYPARPWSPGSRPVSEMIATPRPPGAQAALVGTQRLAAGAPAGADSGAGVLAGEAGELVDVRLAVANADVRDVLQALLGEYLGRSFVVDPAVTGQISLDIDESFTRSEVLDLAGAVIAVLNLTMNERDGVIYIGPMTRVARNPDSQVISTRPAVESEFTAVRVRRLRHLPADQLATLLRDFSSEGAKVAFVGRTLVIADTARQVARLSSLIDALDVPAFSGVEIWTYRLANRPPEEAATILDAIVTATAIGGGTEPLVSFVPIAGTSRLMVISRDATLQPTVTDFVRQADQPKDSEQRGRYVYRVQHMPTTELSVMMRDFFGEKMEKTPGEGNGIRTIVNAQQDVMLVYATPSDFAEMVQVLRAVDRPAQQVVIQSIIAEVRLTDRLQYGVEYFLELNTSLGEIALTGAAALAENANPTGSAFFIGTDGFAIIQALDRESDAKILSQPKIVIRDRDTGSIQVGGEVPVLKATEGAATESGGTSNIREEIEYRDTGVILTIQADINESGLVTLKIDQEINDALPTDVPNQPEFTTRKLETTVVVPHGMTVLLGGIINEDRRNEQNRIPLLGRIPVVGEAFKNSSDTKERSELVLAVTPTIINEPIDARVELTDFLRSTYAVRSALYEFASDLPAGSLQNVAPDGIENTHPLPAQPAPSDPGAVGALPAPAEHEDPMRQWTYALSASRSMIW